MKLKRNDPCPCGSGKKYKKCCYLDPDMNAEVVRAVSKSRTIEEVQTLLSIPAKVYRLKVVLIRMALDEFEDEISRTIEVDEKCTLYKFHLEIQQAFNWDNDHMFSFFMGGRLFDPANEYAGTPFGEHFVSKIGKPSKSAADTEIGDLGLFEDQTFLYLFDYGDELVHEIMVEQIREKTSKDKHLPAVVNEIGQPPPQYDFEDEDEDEQVITRYSGDI